MGVMLLIVMDEMNGNTITGAAGETDVSAGVAELAVLIADGREVPPGVVLAIRVLLETLHLPDAGWPGVARCCPAWSLDRRQLGAT